MYPDRPSLSQLRRLRQITKEMRPDVVHLHGIRAGVLGRLALPPGVPIVFTMHGAHFAFYPRPLRQVYVHLERLLQSRTDKTIFVCRHDLELTLTEGALPRHKGVVIHNGLQGDSGSANPPSGVALSSTGTSVRAELDIPSDSTLMLAVGRLSHQKDYPIMLRALAPLREHLDRNRGHLLIAGEGSERKRIEELGASLELTIPCEDRPPVLRLLGSRTDIPRLLEAADLLLLSSRWEGLPYVLLEAMAAGLPVVSTRVGGVPECVEDEETGLLVPPGDPAALGAAVLRLLDNSVLRRRLGARGRRRIHSHFREDRMVRETERVYAAIAGS